MYDFALMCSSLSFIGMVLGFFALLRYLRYRETMTMMEKGLLRPQLGNGRDTLRWGVVITALGLALCLGLYPLGWTISPGTFPLNFGPWMLLGLGPTFFGLALMAIYVLSRKDDVPQPDEQVETDTELELEEPPA